MSDTELYIVKRKYLEDLRRCILNKHDNPYMFEHKKFLGCYCKNSNVYEYWITFFETKPQTNLNKHLDSAKTTIKYLKKKETKIKDVLSKMQVNYMHIWRSWKKERDQKTYLYLQLVDFETYSHRFCCY